MRRTIFLLFTGIIALPLPAQTDTALTLPPVTVHDARFDRTGFTRWQADTLPAGGALPLSERLWWENAVDVRANAPGTLATLSARGAGPSRTPVFWMGLPLQSPMNGVVDAALLPLWPGDRVEVRYGGQSAMLSSGAMGGAVLVDPWKMDEGGLHPGWHGQAGLGAGSFGRMDVAAGLRRRERSWITELRGRWEQADNDFPFTNTTRPGRPRERQRNNGVEKLDLQHFARFGPSDGHVLETAVWRQRARREIPPTMTQAAAGNRQDDRSTRALARWQYAPGRHGHWNSRLAWMDESIRYRQPGDSDSSLARTVLASTEYTGVAGPGMWWRTGLTAQYQRARADGYADSTRWFGQRRAGAFAMAERARGRGRLSLLLRQEWAEDQAAPFTASLGGQWSMGRAGLLRLHASRNFNLPTLNDRYWANLGNPALRPEKGYSAEAGWNWPGVWWTADLTAFQLLLDDWILWQPGADGLFRPGNLRRVWSRGFEARLQAHGRLGPWHWKAAGRYQRSRATTQAVYSGDQTALYRQLPYTPRQTAHLALHLRQAGFGLAYLHQWTGRRFTTSDNQSALPGFGAATALLRYSWTGRGQVRYALDGRLENLWNAAYQLIEYRPLPGRSWKLGVDVEF
jgi:vitamin B12 transporter